MVWGGLLPIPFYRIHTRLVYYTRLEQRKKKTLLVGSNANNSANDSLSSTIDNINLADDNARMNNYNIIRYERT